MVFYSNLISTLQTGKTTSKQINDQHPTEADDPLLKRQFHDPEDQPRAAKRLDEHAALFLIQKIRKAQGTAALDHKSMSDPTPTKKQRLGSSPTPATAAAARATVARQAAKPKKAPSHSSLLHQSCRLFPQCASVIQSSVEMEPQKASERAQKAPTGSAYLVGDGREPYSLPINILLHHDASLEALKVMAQAAPEALALKDGRDDACSVIVALRLGGNTTTKDGRSIPEELLAANQEAAQVHDKRGNFPLHVATYVGASFTMISNLYWAFPEALLEMNFYGETPLDIAIRNGKCEDRVTNFLHEKMDHLKTARLRRAAASLK